MESLAIAGHVVDFQHGIREINVRSNKKEFTKLQPTTTCILRTNDGEEITKSTVSLHHKDRNDVILAMRHSFKKTVNQIKDVNTRRDLWTDFKPHICK